MVRNKAFTLAGLLAGIAGIAILMAVLFPLFARSREGARGHALTLYVDVFDAKLPMASNLAVPPSDPLRMWPSQVFPYIQNTKVFAYPSGDSRVAFMWADRSWQNVGYSGVTAYDPNGCDDNVTDPRGCEGFKRVISFTELKEPARVALFADTPAGGTVRKISGIRVQPIQWSFYTPVSRIESSTLF